MPVDIFGSAIWHESFTGPDNDDDIDGESVSDGLTQSKDNDNWLRVQTLLRGGWGSFLIPAYAGSGAAVDVPLTLDMASPDPSIVLVEAAAVQVSMSIEAIDDVSGSLYTCRILLHDSVQPLTYEGPAMVGQEGHAVSLLAYFPSVDPGSYAIELRFDPVDSITRSAKSYTALVNVVITVGAP